MISTPMIAAQVIALILECQQKPELHESGYFLLSIEFGKVDRIIQNIEVHYIASMVKP